MTYRIAASAWLLCAACAVAGTWQTPARLDRLLKRPVAGTLLFGDSTVEFRSPKVSFHWPYGEISTFRLVGGTELVLSDYAKSFRFRLSQPMPPEIATEFTARVGPPVINGDPNPVAAIIAEIPAHHRKRLGGSDGMLRLRENGIDYVSTNGRDGRSWRWSDIQTLANPDPWEFRVMAYREIVEFDLKQPLSRALFDRLWDRLYAGELR